VARVESLSSAWAAISLLLRRLACAAGRVKPAAVVPERFYAETAYDHEIRGFCRRQRIVYQSFPGRLSANPPVPAHAVISASGNRSTGRYPEQICSYLTQIDVVPLTGNPVRDYCARTGDFEFELTDRERDAVDSIL